MVALPEGTVTFLFSDVEGSTSLWEEFPGAMSTALDQHDAVFDRAVEAHEGLSVKPRGEGDSRFVVFPDAGHAVAAVAAVQQGLAETDWATGRPLRVRIAIHTGVAELKQGDYYGSIVNRAARLRSIAHGGQTVISASTQELVRDRMPAGVTLRDLGEHGLRDLSRPEHVFQVDVAGLPTTFPPLNSLDSVPNNLPTQVTEFVGRVDELENVRQLIGKTHLLTILAPGGAGKTRLAIQAAADLSDGFPDGVFFVDLAPITASEDLAQAIAESLGLALLGEDPPREQLLSYLGHKRQLLILDNLEHLEGAGALVSSILKAAPEVRVIATSRSKLNVQGETVMGLSGLDTEWDSDLEAIETSGAKLFFEAAMRADPSFLLGDGDVEYVKSIIVSVDGMPLGILLAAAWTDVLSVGEIAAEIANSLDFLETEMGDVPDRHRSIRAVFDYTWSMLSEEERGVFAKLSVFRDGFTRTAAEFVTGTSLRGLANLVAKSLVVADRDTGRYRMHELLRQYAEDALREDEGSWQSTMEAHLEFFAELAARSEILISQSDQVQALAITEDDLDNIKSAWRRSLTTRNGGAARSFALALWALHEIRGWNQAAHGLFDDALEAFDVESADEAESTAGWLITALKAKYLTNLGQPGEGAVLLERSVRGLQNLGDIVAHLVAVESLCENLTYRGEIEELVTVASEGVRLADAAGLEFWSAGFKNYQGIAHMQTGSLKVASALLEEGEEVMSRLGDMFMRPWNLSISAMIASMQGHPDEAATLNSQVVAISRQIGYPRATYLGLIGLGEARVAGGEYDKARDAYLESLAMTDDMGLVAETADLMIRLAEVSAKTGKAENAVEILACVLADRVSDRLVPLHELTISDKANQVLSDLRNEMREEPYSTAHARGRTMSLETAVKELLTT